MEHFQSSTQRATNIRKPASNNKSKGYGFVSFADPLQLAKALREMEQTWLGTRPIRVKRSHWKDWEVTTSSSNKDNQQMTKTNKKR